uniref:Uncharacterized protein n=1 Tax=Rangifer tarandus platyrhynchus TaxID=3082113 RepID=A0ACB0FB41_RANTA|nr:unnamed protein product [Rangifer tarandus platyrhynchus]
MTIVSILEESRNHKTGKLTFIPRVLAEELRNNLPDGMALKLKLKQKQLAARKAGGTAQVHRFSDRKQLVRGNWKKPLQLVQREQGESRLG